MSKYVLICIAVVTSSFVFVTSFGDMTWLGKGKWLFKNVEKCPDDNQYLNTFTISRRKVNRTHDGFSADIHLIEDIDSSNSIRIEICKEVDGGCKPYHVLTDHSFCGFVNKYAKENFVKVLRLGGVDPPDCPIPKGNYSIQKFIFDYSELPEDGVFGNFKAKSFLMKAGEDYGCLNVNLEFKNNADD